MACVLRRGDHVPFDAFIPPIRLVAPCRAIPLPARFVSGFGERASVPRLGFGLGRIWVSRVSLPLSIYYSCVYLQYIVIVIVSIVIDSDSSIRLLYERSGEHPNDSTTHILILPRVFENID